MIVAERKTIPELVDILRPHKNILVLGCGTCVTVCLSGGEREVSIISSALRIASRVQGLSFHIDELTIERQCDNIFIEQPRKPSRKPTPCCRRHAVPGSRRLPSVFPRNRFTPDSTRLFWASWRSAACGRKSAPPAAPASCTNTGAFVPLPAAPSV